MEYLKKDSGFADADAKNLVNSFFSEIELQLTQNNSIKFYGFAGFTKSTPQNRKIKNINTGIIEEVTIHSKIKFKRNKKKA